MVVTHKKIAEQKKKPIPRKKDDPRRKFMTKAQALEANRKLRENRDKVADYAAQLEAEGDAQVTIPRTEQSIVPKDVDNSEAISALEQKISEEKGPGSKARKAKIQAKIDVLKGAS